MIAFIFGFVVGVVVGIGGLMFVCWLFFRGMDADERNCDRDEAGVA